MAEYIEREAVLEKNHGGVVYVDDIEKIPAADVAPMVSCEDCKHLCVWNRKDIYAFCPKTNIEFLPFEQDTRTFYCSYGERKEVE